MVLMRRSQIVREQWQKFLINRKIPPNFLSWRDFQVLVNSSIRLVGNFR